MATCLLRWLGGRWEQNRAASTHGRKWERRPAGMRRPFLPHLDLLEDRTLPSTFMVTNLLDSGSGSLRQAIVNAGSSQDNSIVFAVTGTITLASPLPELDTNLNLLGPGPERLTIQRSTADGTPDFSVFTINNAVVNLSGLTIANGSALWGGGIFNNEGTLTVNDCTLVRNAALRGGGITNFGSLTVSNSTIAGNTATSQGGGIANFGPLSITYSTLAGNAASSGGALYNFDGAILAVSYSTLADNTADFGGGIAIEGGMVSVTSSTLAFNAATVGGGILNSLAGILAVANSTLVGNAAAAQGGGIENDAGSLTVSNATISGNWAAQGGGIRADGSVVCRDSIFAGNSAADGPDLSGSFISQGHNLLGDSSGADGFDPSDLLNLDPLLQPLQDNGGPTQTMALLPDSPARSAGDATDAPEWDQRGPGFSRLVNGSIDIGAFEVQPAGTANRAQPPVSLPGSLMLVTGSDVLAPFEALLLTRTLGSPEVAPLVGQACTPTTLGSGGQAGRGPGQAGFGLGSKVDGAAEAMGKALRQISFLSNAVSTSHDDFFGTFDSVVDVGR